MQFYTFSIDDVIFISNQRILMKLYKIFEDIQRDVDPSAQSSANVVLMMDKLKTNQEFAGILRQLTMPSDKFKAIVKFAGLLGIPDERLIDFIQQQKNQGNNDQKTGA